MPPISGGFNDVASDALAMLAAMSEADILSALRGLQQRQGQTRLLPPEQAWASEEPIKREQRRRTSPVRPKQAGLRTVDVDGAMRRLLSPTVPPVRFPPAAGAGGPPSRRRSPPGPARRESPLSARLLRCASAPSRLQSPIVDRLHTSPQPQPARLQRTRSVQPERWGPSAMPSDGQSPRADPAAEPPASFRELLQRVEQPHNPDARRRVASVSSASHRAPSPERPRRRSPRRQSDRQAKRPDAPVPQPRASAPRPRALRCMPSPPQRLAGRNRSGPPPAPAETEAQGRFTALLAAEGAARQALEWAQASAPVFEWFRLTQPQQRPRAVPVLPLRRVGPPESEAIVITSPRYPEGSSDLHLALLLEEREGLQRRLAEVEAHRAQLASENADLKDRCNSLAAARLPLTPETSASAPLHGPTTPPRARCRVSCSTLTPPNVPRRTPVMSP